MRRLFGVHPDAHPRGEVQAFEEPAPCARNARRSNGSCQCRCSTTSGSSSITSGTRLANRPAVGPRRSSTRGRTAFNSPCRIRRRARSRYLDPDTKKIVGVALCDETELAWSAIYFFYHPDWAKHSIGTANIVFQVELARSRAIPYVYLGYRVDGCPSLAYKASFRPQERLVGWPEFREQPVWEEVAAGQKTTEVEDDAH